MKSFFKKILLSATPHAKFISRDLKRLNKVKAGMGDAAVSYVISGDPETVLATLSNTGSGNILRVCATYSFHDINKKVVDLERPFKFLDMVPYDADILMRYAQVLAAVCQSSLPRMLGSKNVPLAMRIAFTEASLAALDPKQSWSGVRRSTPPIGLTLDRLIPLAQALGGTTAQLFEILFWENNDYDTPKVGAFRTLLDPSTLIMAHAADAIKGAAECPAPGREIFVKALIAWKLTQQQPFLGFLMSCTGDPSKSVREAAQPALRSLPADIVEPLAIEQLSKGKVGVRAGMVEILSGLGTDIAIAALRTHLKTEKTARIVAAIENAFSASEMASDAGQESDDGASYTAIDGSRVEIPPLQPLQDGPGLTLTAADRKTLKGAVAKENDRIKSRNTENKAKKYNYQQPLLSSDLVARTQEHVTNPHKNRKKLHEVRDFLATNPENWSVKALDRLSEKPALTLAFGTVYSLQIWANAYAPGLFHTYIQKYLASEHADMRALDGIWQEAGFNITLGDWRNKANRNATKGDLLRSLISESYYDSNEPDLFPTAALWPLVADNFDVIDHAMGMVSNDDFVLSQPMAIKYIGALPKTPMRYFGPLLEVATGERIAGKADARAALADVPQVTDRLITLLADSRQAIRKGAAEWLAARDNTAAIPALKAQLKKEKSELAKAALLTALRELGEPLESYVGPTVLIREAEAGLKKAKFDKLDWLNLDHLPAAKFKNGKKVPADVLRWWIYLAFKLKQPGGNALFEIYLDQLSPDSAAAFSQWIFDSWITYDTVVPSDIEANAYAEKNVAQRLNTYRRWDANITREQIFAMLKREIKSQYENSGTTSKGILGFASRVPPQIAADRVRAYLRNHGSRTSQASSLLEVLAQKGDPVSLQVVIAAATRLKQKSVQKTAGDLVKGVADKMNWSLDELADRTIPTAGLDEDGNLDLPCGVDEKRYRATLGDDIAFVLKNPDGKIVKALSSASDETTKASKKQLSASKKELKQVLKMQTARLYEALCGERIWPLADWQRDFVDHPIMRRLIERVVWQGLDADNKVLGNFRPTSEGEFIDTKDTEVDINSFAGVRLAHGATLSTEAAEQWGMHLKDYEVKPLFAQFGRTLIRLPDDQKDATKIDDRKGWISETFAIRGAATKLGYERGQAEDGAWFYDYRKAFTGVGLTAVVEFTGNYLPEENRNAALISLSFEKNLGRHGQKVKLSEVPPVLLSECWNDLHAMSAKGAYDANWEKNTLW